MRPESQAVRGRDVCRPPRHAGHARPIALVGDVRVWDGRTGRRRGPRGRAVLARGRGALAGREGQPAVDRAGVGVDGADAGDPRGAVAQQRPQGRRALGGDIGPGEAAGADQDGARDNRRDGRCGGRAGEGCRGHPGGGGIERDVRGERGRRHTGGDEAQDGEQEAEQRCGAPGRWSHRIRVRARMCG